MSVLLVLGAIAYGQGACEGTWSSVDDHLSVAWIAPRRRRVARRSVLTVVPTVDVMAFVQREGASVGRLLEHIGQRRGRRREPRRAFKVLVFDVSRSALCRPLAGVAPGTVVGSVGACEVRDRHLDRTDGCGSAVDRATHRSDLPVFRAEWGELVRGGFCVLPADRFVRQ